MAKSALTAGEALALHQGDSARNAGLVQKYFGGDAGKLAVAKAAAESLQKNPAAFN